MKKPQVDYRKFKLTNINSPEFSHLKLLLGWVGYFALFFLTERFIKREACYVIHSPLDDLIPFCEVFVIPYVLWYLLIVLSLGYFLVYNVDSFKRLQKFIIITQIVAMAVYIIFPNMQPLRPTEFARDNIFTDMVGFLYTIDTNTNVCPSLHVAYSIAIASVWVKEKGISPWFKAFIVVFVILICLSTVFIKQHSVIDGFAAIPLCILGEIIIYGKDFWLPKFKRTKNC